MFTYNLSIHPKATQEILNIKYYIKYVLCNEKAASDFEKTLDEKLDLIQKNPHMYQGETLYNNFYRFVSVKKYILAFYIDENNRIVHITNVGHCKQNRYKLIKQ